MNGQGCARQARSSQARLGSGVPGVRNMAETGGTRSGGMSHNVYTVLLGVAFLALLIGVGYVWYRFADLFGTPNPFDLSQASFEMLRLSFPV